MAATRYPYGTAIPLGYRDRFDIKPPVVGQTPAGDFSAAAGIVNINDAYNSLIKKHDYDGLISNEIANNANEFNTKLQVEGELLGSYAISQAAIDAARYNYEVGKKRVNAGKQMAGQAGALDVVGKVAKVGLPLLFSAMSDEKVKNTIEAIEDATSKLRALRPVSYYYNEGYTDAPERKHHGFIAQQYQEVLPDATYTDKETGTMSIDLGDVIGILVRGFQELDTRITRIEAKNALLAGVK